MVSTACPQGSRKPSRGSSGLRLRWGRGRAVTEFAESPLSSGARQHCRPAGLAWHSFQALHSQGCLETIPATPVPATRASTDRAWLFEGLCQCSRVHKQRWCVTSNTEHALTGKQGLLIRVWEMCALPPEPPCSRWAEGTHSRQAQGLASSEQGQPCLSFWLWDMTGTEAL